MQALYSDNGTLNWQTTKPIDCPVGFARVQIAAAGLNRADLHQRKGKYPPPSGVTDILGLECSGIITEVNQVTQWRVGDRVCALLPGGAMATEVIVDARHLLPVPKNFSLIEAAIIPEVYSTAWLNIFQIAHAKPNDKVLIHGGAGGVGSAAIQLCKVFNNPCWVTVGSQERLDYCVSLGAQGGAIRTDNLEQLKKFAPFDVILDHVGANYFDLNINLLNTDARWVMIAMLGGHKTEINLATLIAKRIQLTGSTLRSRSSEFKAQLIKELTEKVWPKFETNELNHGLAKMFPISQVNEAFQSLESNQIQGKIALVINKNL